MACAFRASVASRPHLSGNHALQCWSGHWRDHPIVEFHAQRVGITRSLSVAMKQTPPSR